MSASMLAHPRQQSVMPACLAGLLESLEHSTGFEATDAAAMLAGLSIEAADLAAWHDYGHPVQDSYGRLLVQRGANYELMVMSWLPGDYSAIHDHGQAEWGAVRYFGCADHVTFTHHDGLLSTKDRMTMQVGDVFAVEPSLIHLMGNPMQSPFVSLHLYGRQQAAETITGGARIFDLFENRIQRTDGGVFFCLPECDINAREPGPGADTSTRLLHHQLMLDRIERISRAGIRDQALAERAVRLRHEIMAL